MRQEPPELPDDVLSWHRRQTRDPQHVDHRARAAELADLLGRVLNEFQFVIDEHGECSSCQVDLEIFARKAADLGVVAERVRDTSSGRPS